MTPHHEPTRGESVDDAPAPILGSWSRLYTLVIAELVAVIVLCGWLSRLR